MSKTTEFSITNVLLIAGLITAVRPLRISTSTTYRKIYEFEQRYGKIDPVLRSEILVQIASKQHDRIVELEMKNATSSMFLKINKEYPILKEITQRHSQYLVPCNSKGEIDQESYTFRPGYYRLAGDHVISYLDNLMHRVNAYMSHALNPKLAEIRLSETLRTWSNVLKDIRDNANI